MSAIGSWADDFDLGEFLGVGLDTRQLGYLAAALFLGLFGLSALRRADRAGGPWPAVWIATAVGLILADFVVAPADSPNKSPKTCDPGRCRTGYSVWGAVLVLLGVRWCSCRAYWVRTPVARLISRAAAWPCSARRLARRRAGSATNSPTRLARGRPRRDACTRVSGPGIHCRRDLVAPARQKPHANAGQIASLPCRVAEPRSCSPSGGSARACGPSCRSMTSAGWPWSSPPWEPGPAADRQRGVPCGCRGPYRTARPRRRPEVLSRPSAPGRHCRSRSCWTIRDDPSPAGPARSGRPRRGVASVSQRGLVLLRGVHVPQRTECGVNVRKSAAVENASRQPFGEEHRSQSAGSQQFSHGRQNAGR